MSQIGPSVIVFLILNDWRGLLWKDVNSLPRYRQHVLSTSLVPAVSISDNITQAWRRISSVGRSRQKINDGCLTTKVGEVTGTRVRQGGRPPPWMIMDMSYSTTQMYGTGWARILLVVFKSDTIFARKTPRPFLRNPLFFCIYIKPKRKAMSPFVRPLAFKTHQDRTHTAVNHQIFVNDVMAGNAPTYSPHSRTRIERTQRSPRAGAKYD